MITADGLVREICTLVRCDVLLAVKNFSHHFKIVSNSKLIGQSLLKIKKIVIPTLVPIDGITGVVPSRKEGFPEIFTFFPLLVNRERQNIYLHIFYIVSILGLLALSLHFMKF